MTTASRSSRVYGGQPPEVRVAERRRAFVEAGIELIGTHGLRAATVRAVCARAQLTDRYFYESFDDGEALLIGVYEELAARLSAALAAAMNAAPDTLEAKVDAGLAAFFEFMRDPRAARILLMEILGVSEAVTAMYLRSAASFADLILGAAAPFVPARAETQRDRKLIGQALIGAIVYAAGAWALGGYRMPLARVHEACRTIVLGTLERLLRDRRR